MNQYITTITFISEGTVLKSIILYEIRNIQYSSLKSQDVYKIIFTLMFTAQQLAEGQRLLSEGVYKDCIIRVFIIQLSEARLLLSWPELWHYELCYLSDFSSIYCTPLFLIFWASFTVSDVQQTDRCTKISDVEKNYCLLFLLSDMTQISFTTLTSPWYED